MSKKSILLQYCFVNEAMCTNKRMYGCRTGLKYQGVKDENHLQLEKWFWPPKAAAVEIWQPPKAARSTVCAAAKGGCGRRFVGRRTRPAVHFAQPPKTAAVETLWAAEGGPQCSLRSRRRRIAVKFAQPPKAARSTIHPEFLDDLSDIFDNIIYQLLFWETIILSPPVVLRLIFSERSWRRPAVQGPNSWKWRSRIFGWS